MANVFVCLKYTTMKNLKKILVLVVSILVLSCEKQEIGQTDIARTEFISAIDTKKKLLEAQLMTEKAAFGKRAGHSSVIFKDKMWVFAGTDGGNHKNDIWFSKEGATWLQATKEAKFPPRYDHATEVFQNKIWVMGGRGNTVDGIDEMNDFWTSSDGSNWEQIIIKQKIAPRFWHTLTSFKGCLWLIGVGVAQKLLVMFGEAVTEKTGFKLHRMPRSGSEGDIKQLFLTTNYGS